MGTSSDLVHIIILALIAVFIALRLRSVLGSRTGNERPHDPSHSPGPNQFSGGTKWGSQGRNGGQGPDQPVIDLSNRQGVWTARDDGTPDQAPDVAQALAAIARHEPGFAPQAFLSGAQTAFGMIVEAFAAGDRATLRPLVSDTVFAGFDQAIAQRERAQAEHEPWSRHRLIRVDSAAIAAATVREALAEITVRFASIQAVSDFQGQASRDSQAALTDLWTFQRRLGAADPTWTLIATRSLETENG